MTAADEVGRRALELASVEFIDENGGGPGGSVREHREGVCSIPSLASP